jgi:hypothetical protein
MPFCPECRDEFQDWVKTCPDCRIALVAEMPTPSRPAKRGKAGDSLVHIADAPNELVGQMWAEVLKEHGIRCLTKGGKAPGDMSGNSPCSACEMYVLASEAQRARKTLDGLPDSKRPS